MEKINIAELKNQYKIEDIVSKKYGVALKPNGDNKLTGICPFHSENTPSFTIFIKEQKYHCFGCYSNGDVIDFIQKMEGINKFPEALSILGTNSASAVKKSIADKPKEEHKTIATECSERYQKAKEFGEEDSNEYLKSKGVLPIKGLRYDKELLVPLMDVNLKIWNLQKIAKKQDSNSFYKLFCKGAKKQGLFFPIGMDKFKDATTIYIAEGISTALSIYEATKEVTLCTFGANNIKDVTEAIRNFKPKAEIIICADNDKWAKNEKGEVIEREAKDNIGLVFANEAAEKYNCKVVYPEFPENLKEKMLTDFNDLLLIYGRAEVKSQIMRSSKSASKLKSNKKSKIKKEKILEFLQSTIMEEFWHDIDNKKKLYVTALEDGIYRHLKIGESLKDHITLYYYQRFNEILSKNTLDNIIAIFRAESMRGKSYKVYNRVANIDNDFTYYNLANPENKILRINNKQIEVIKMTKEIKITAGTGTKEQCEPDISNHNIHLLKEVVNCGEKEDFVLIAIYLAYCLQGKAPYPILNICGEQGSGKSELCTKLVSLVDPTQALSCSMPDKEEDLHILAKRRAILYFDNVSSINNKTSDWLCKLTTGAGTAKRELFTDDDEHSFSVSAGVILNGINNTVERPDLMDRCITINLPILKERKSTQELNKKFEELKPKILGGIMDLLVVAFSKKDSEKVKRVIESNKENIPRMIDYCIFGTACEEYLGLQEGEFIEICKRKEREAIELTLENDTIMQAIISVIKEETTYVDKWSTTPTELYNKVWKELQEKYKNNFQRMPKAPNQLTRLINRKKPNLRIVEGICVEEARTNSSQKLIITKHEVNHDK